MAKAKMHFADLRLRVNAAMNMPICYVGKGPLDLDKSRLPVTSDMSKVTCKRCIKAAKKRYPWASFCLPAADRIRPMS
jgi:hypothetical protein